MASDIHEFKELLGRFGSIPEQDENPTTSEELEQFKRLLDAFRLVPESKETSRKTFFEICGISSREVYYSTFLAYFFNPKEKHGFEDLFLRSLVQASGQKLDMEDFTSVETEVPTDKGRIDLVIEGNSFVIGIENKIWAPVNNDFEDYCNHIKKLASNGKRTPLLILLSLNQEKENQGFKSVLYQNFIEKIKENIGQFLPKAEPRSITYLLDFISSIEHQKKGTRMDPALLKFFQAHEETSLKFYQKAEELKGMLREKVKNVKKIVEVELPPIFQKACLWEAMDNEPQKEGIYDAVMCEFKMLDSSKCSADAELYLTKDKGWIVQVYSYENTDKLGAWLKNVGIECKLAPDGFRWVYAQIPFEQSVETIAAKYNELLKAIGDKLGEKKK